MTDYAGRRVAVFGAGGALGAALTAAFTAAGAAVVGLDRAVPDPARRVDGVDYRALDVLDDTALGAWFESVAHDTIDLERIVERRSLDGNVHRLPTGILITQFLHHGNEHRAQLGSLFGANGIEPPHYSAFDWGRSLGKMS